MFFFGYVLDVATLKVIKFSFSPRVTGSWPTLPRICILFKPELKEWKERWLNQNKSKSSSSHFECNFSLEMTKIPYKLKHVFILYPKSKYSCFKRVFKPQNFINKKMYTILLTFLYRSIILHLAVESESLSRKASKINSSILIIKQQKK